MNTQLIYLGQQKPGEATKPIEFKLKVNTKTGTTQAADRLPSSYKFVVVVQEATNIKNFDTFFAYNNDSSRGATYLGHLNDRIIN